MRAAAARIFPTFSILSSCHIEYPLRPYFYRAESSDSACPHRAGAGRSTLNAAESSPSILPSASSRRSSSFFVVMISHRRLPSRRRQSSPVALHHRERPPASARRRAPAESIGLKLPLAPAGLVVDVGRHGVDLFLREPVAPRGHRVLPVGDLHADLFAKTICTRKDSIDRSAAKEPL